MNDAEYIFQQTSAERKRNGYGDYHKKRGGGHSVRFPSDNLTKKEKQMLNSDVTKIDLNSPVTWPEFRLWPSDLQLEYLQKLENTYNASPGVIASMMGISYWRLRDLMKSLGVPGQQGKRRVLDAVGWAEFCKQDGANAPEVVAPETTVKAETSEQKEEKTYTIRDACVEHMKEEVKQIDIQNIAVMLRGLVGTGAKLTIEVTL